MHTFWLVALTPLIWSVCFLLPAHLIARVIGKRMREGPLKRLLFFPLDAARERRRREWLLARYRAGKAMMPREIAEAARLDAAARAASAPPSPARPPART